ncbi:MAG: O-antigen ligase family protein [bacterium]
MKFFLTIFLILPLICSHIGYEGTKVLFFLVFSFFLALYLLRFKINEILKSLNKTDFIYFFWLFFLTISSLLGVHPTESILGGSYRHQGVLFFFSLWFWGKLVFFLNKTKKRKIFIQSLIFVLLVESVLVIYQKVFSLGLSFGRPLGTFGEPNAIAGFLVLASFFLIKGKKILNLSKLNYLFLAIVFAAIILTQSRAGIFSFIFLISGEIVIEKVKVSRKIFFWILAAITIVIFGLIFKRPNAKFENRTLFLSLAWNQILDKPFLGYGAESGEVVFDRAFKNAEMPLFNFMVDRAHNIFVDVAIWSGFLGLTVFFAWVVLVLKNLWKKGRKETFFAALVFLIFACFQPLSVVHWVFFILIINW